MHCNNLFFLIYIKDMPKKFKLSTRRKYAWCKGQQNDKCQVTVEHVPVPVSCEPSDASLPEQLIVSVPCSALLSFESSSLTLLRHRVAKMSTLPSGKMLRHHKF